MQVARLLAITLVLAVLAAGCESRSESVRSYRSPDGTSRLEVRGADDWPHRFWQNRVVTVRLEGQQPIPIYEGDGLDASFDSLFRLPEFVGTNVIRFPSSIPVDRRWSLVIENHSTSTVDWMIVRILDLFLIRDLQPGQSVTLVTSAPQGVDFFGAAVTVFDQRVNEMASHIINAPAEASRAAGLTIEVRQDDVFIRFVDTHKPPKGP
jgi:hypothetical protein